jgi:hypothetical protein
MNISSILEKLKLLVQKITTFYVDVILGLDIENSTYD